MPDPFSPPDLADFAELKWWTTLEAAFVLAGWPKDDHYWSSLSPRELIPEDILEDRGDFLLPGSFRLQLNKYSKAFQEVFRAINDAILAERLSGKYFKIAEGVHHLVNPIEILMWALKSGYGWPVDLQKALKTKPQRQFQNRPWKKKVKIITYSQYYVLDHPGAALKDIIQSGWFNRYSIEEDPTKEFMPTVEQLRDHLTGFLSIGLPGRPKRGLVPDTTCKIQICPITEVIKLSKTHCECNFELFDIVIEAAARVQNSIFGLEKILEIPLPEFIKLLKQDKILRLYLKGAPKFVGQFIEHCLFRSYHRLCEAYTWMRIPKALESKFKVQMPYNNSLN